MSANTPHARLLNDAALKFLEPLGLEQVGRSRIWLDDHDWWLILVEFQPDSSARGSYLNVGVMWLWRDVEEFSFDVGYRVGDFKPFRNKAQFEREAMQMAARAEHQVRKYRARFVSVAEAANYLTRQSGGDPWTSYHAGVACALAGRGAEACRWLDQFLQQGRHAAWSESLLRRAVQLRALADHVEDFHAAVAQVVAASRAALRLPAAAGRLFGIER